MAVKSTGANETLNVLVGQSVILHGASNMSKIYIGNPAILQTYNPSADQLVVTSKAPGVTSLVLWDAQGRSCLYTVLSNLDPAPLRSAIDMQYPSNDIHIDSREDVISISGTVPTLAESDAITKLASTYSKNIANSLRLVPVRGKQIELKLRIVEVDRTKAEQFGINLFGGTNNAGGFGTNQFQGTQVQDSNGVSTFLNPLNLFYYNAATNLAASLQDLEQKNILQILSEPTLTTMDGLPARFLSGGEFPFPVAQGGGVGGAVAVSISFRPYGVKVDFTPSINGDGSIRVKIAPEVSTLDYTNAVSISGFTVPAIATRRAETEIELRDGQSFALSGLLDHRTTEQLSKIPGIADIPVLGQLFRSRNISRSVTELVVIATVHVVDPFTETGLPTPAISVKNIDKQKFDNQIYKERPKDAPKPVNGTVEK